MPDKIKVVYDAASQDFDLGTLDEFTLKMQDDAKRKLFYDAVSQDYDLGDFDTFSSKVKKKKMVSLLHNFLALVQFPYRKLKTYLEKL
mgnify:CR=1 FL=1